MQVHVTSMIRQALRLSTRTDEGLLAGPSDEAMRDLGAPTPVLSLFRNDVAALCPDLVHEAQWSLSRHE